MLIVGVWFIMSCRIKSLYLDYKLNNGMIVFETKADVKNKKDKRITLWKK